MSEPKPVEQTGLAAKLANAAKAISSVDKDGRNDHFKYDFTSAERMLAATRGPLLDNGIVLFPSLVESRRDGTLTTVSVQFRIVDVETGQVETAVWEGTGDDRADKGHYKAYTGCIRTFLRMLLLLPQGEDPESDTGTDRRAETAGNGSELASEGQQVMILKRAGQADVPPSLLANIVLVATGSQPREFADEDSAVAWVRKALKRLPARLVDTVVANVAAEADVKAPDPA